MVYELGDDSFNGSFNLPWGKRRIVRTEPRLDGDYGADINSIDGLAHSDDRKLLQTAL